MITCIDFREYVRRPNGIASTLQMRSVDGFTATEIGACIRVEDSTGRVARYPLAIVARIEETDAVQESATAQVDVQEPSRVSRAVGARDAEGQAPAQANAQAEAPEAVGRVIPIRRNRRAG